ncbi:Protease Do-like 9 [Auxenochlorella protothecoides]|uniref:Protease Do-like 9 n=1 Tax=Auxenochlorella protothecoides TaxID=3075 RepID=A0A087SU69_AUXPR|nr:Protease Do-like 9 [Auxenochlorella protothecoides]KFM29273.1 Protease Do-like 9 [Auxenochlorella protothecoides]
MTHNAGIVSKGYHALHDPHLNTAARYLGEVPSMPEGADGLETINVMDAVCKVFCVHTEPDMSLPWQRKRQYSSTSSGFVIALEGDRFGGKYLLTNAHSVENHSQARFGGGGGETERRHVKVKRRDDDSKFLAKVLAIGTECDIALLTVEDPEFWKDVEPVVLGPLPQLQDSVFVVGYPVGGDTISVTSGVVSRIEVTSYAHGATELLGVQIDAAINSGNSGGPVFNEAGECVGVAFQSYAGSEAENIGYVIPTPVIHHFLVDYQRNGTFTGFPALGIQWQRMESATLRHSHGMAPGQKGVLVREVLPLSEAAGVLQPGDVLMQFDQTQIANDGTVGFRSNERIAYSFLTSQKFTGDVASLRVLREGKELDLCIKLMRPDFLVPHHLFNKDPSYFVVAGLVFTNLTEPYLASEFGPDYLREAPVKLLDRLLYTHKDRPGQQVVMLNQVLACEATIGYEDISNSQVAKFNDVKVNSLQHLVELVQENREPFMRFNLESKEVLVLDASLAQACTEEMQVFHSIPHALSKDLREALGIPVVAAQAA